MGRIDIGEPLHAVGRIRLATHAWRPEYEGMSSRHILSLLDTPDETSEQRNTLCVNGLNLLVQSLIWSSVEDVNNALGAPFTQTFMAPLGGAVGTGVTAPTSGDLNLTNEVARTSCTGAGSINATVANNPAIAWMFLFGAPSSSYTVAEAGVYLQTSESNGVPTIGTGYLLNHALVSPTVAWSTTQLLTMQVTMTFGN